MDCVAGCPDGHAGAPCQHTCIHDHREAALGAPAVALSACFTSGCAAECGPCGPPAASITEACGVCMETSGAACEDAAGCAGDPGCLAFALCLAGCEDPACGFACLVDAPEYAKTWSGIRVDAFDFCSEACELGTRWECLGDYTWKAHDPSKVVPVDLALVDALSAEPAAGLHVEVCEPNDILCEAPAVEGDTGEDGTLHFDLSVSSTKGFQGHFRISGKLGDAEVMPYLYHLQGGSRTSVFATLGVMSRATLDLLVGASGLGEIQEGRGYLIAQASDCQLFPAAGLEFTMTGAEGMGPIYFQDGFPDAEATTTDVSGIATWGHMEVGPTGTILVDVSARFPGAEEDLVADKVLVRADHLTNYLLVPRWKE